MAKVNRPARNVEQDVDFMEPVDFMDAQGHKKMRVVSNENTGKLSVLADNKTFYKCQQIKNGFDPKKPVAFLILDGDMEQACLVNIERGESPLTTIVDLVGA